MSRQDILKRLGRGFEKPKQLQEEISSYDEINVKLESIDPIISSLALKLHLQVYLSYTVFKVSYKVEENADPIWAWLLVPRNNGQNLTNCPCVLAIHQHGGEFRIGKSEPAGLDFAEFRGEGATLNHYGPRLCALGFAVFCPDMLAFEDRRPSASIREQHDGHLEGRHYEHFEALRYSLQGSCLQHKYIHDLSVAIDVLHSPLLANYIDPNRIASLGHSMGGQEAFWIGWYDKRIKAVVSCCGASMVKDIVDNNILHNRALYLPGLFEIGDIDCVLKGIAPKPLFMAAGSKDWLFPLNGVEHLYSELRKTYLGQGVQDKLELLTFEGGHTFEMDTQAKAYAFLSTWLK